MKKVFASKHFWLFVSVVWMLIVVALPLDTLLMIMLVLLPACLMVVWAWLPENWKNSVFEDSHH